MSPTDDHFLESIQEPPEVKACLSIILEYLECRLSLEDAAPLLRDALRANPHGINIDMSPRLRALFSEIARLEGYPAPDLGPDPNRHHADRPYMLRDLNLQAWDAIEQYPGRPRSFRCHFAAASQASARSIVEWLERHGHEVSLESPEEADSDDWIVIADTPSRHWTRDAVDEWAESVSNTPLGTDASFRGWSV